MHIQERSYSAKTFRPKPYIHMEPDGSLLVVATSWGRAEHAQMTAEEVAKYVSAAQGDVEVTSPFEFLTCLSDGANHLRIGLLIANEFLYRGENKNEYQCGVEVLAISRKGSQVAWAQVGSPHVLLNRQGRPLVPLSTVFDHSFEMSLSGRKASPLPSHFLGVDPTCNVMCGDLQATSRDSLILLASSLLPPSLWTTTGAFDLLSVTQRMISEDPESPFWLGHVVLDGI